MHFQSRKERSGNKKREENWIELIFYDNDCIAYSAIDHLKLCGLEWD
jgi:hypothetical protein